MGSICSKDESVLNRDHNYIIYIMSHEKPEESKHLDKKIVNRYKINENILMDIV